MSKSKPKAKSKPKQPKPAPVEEKVVQPVGGSDGDGVEKAGPEPVVEKVDGEAAEGAAAPVQDVPDGAPAAGERSADTGGPDLVTADPLLLEHLKGQIDRLASFLIANHPDAIVDGGAVDVAIALIEKLSAAPPPAEDAPAQNIKRKLSKIRQGEIELIVKVPGYTPRARVQFDPARTDAAKRSQLLDDAIDELAELIQ